MAFTFSVPDALLSTTLMNYRKQLSDNIFNAIPFYWWLHEKGRKETRSGGESIVEPLLYGANDTVAAYSGYEVLDTTPSEAITAAKFTWKQVAGSIAISGREERQNSGESQIINLLKARTTQTEKSMTDFLSAQLFSANTDSSSGPLGLQTMITIAGTGTVGGINSGTYSWWGNQQRDSFATDGTYVTAANLRKGMAAVYNGCSQGQDQPNLILMSQTAFEWYEELLTPLKQFVDAKTADAGFQNLLYKGAVCMWDRDFPNDLGGTASDEGMYNLNSKYLKLVVHEDCDMITTPFVRSNLWADYKIQNKESYIKKSANSVNIPRDNTELIKMCREHKPTTKVMMCSDLYSNMQNMAEMTISVENTSNNFAREPGRKSGLTNFGSLKISSNQRGISERTTPNKIDGGEVMDRVYQLQRLNEETPEREKRQSELQRKLESVAEMSTPAKVKLIKELHWEQNQSLRDIAKIMGLSWGGLQHYIRQYNIPVKSRAQSLLDKYDGHSPYWKGGRHLFTESRKNGSQYWYVYMPDHPNANHRGYVLEHRYVASQMIGRPLKENEVVHHKDGNKLNNDPLNLEVRNRGGYNQYHGYLTVCPFCGHKLN